MLSSQSDTLRSAKPVSHTIPGGRNVQTKFEEPFVHDILYFEPSVQDVVGDGTVPYQSGAGVRGHVKRVFRTVGYDHQGSYNDKHSRMLTQHLIVKIAQDAKS